MPSKATAFNTKSATIAAEAGQKPVRVDGPSGRFYQINGESYPSVTHILSVIGKPALINWAANQERALVLSAAAQLYEDLPAVKMPTPAYVTTLQARCGKLKAHQRELAKGGDIGSQIHRLIEWNLRRIIGQEAGPEPRVVDDAQWAFMAWQDWAASVDLRPKKIEQMVWSPLHRYAGTMDLLADVRGVETLIDFKSGKAIYPEAHLQNVAYQQALVDMGHAAPKAGCIVRLPKVQTDPAFEVAETPPRGDLMPVFLATQALWRWSFANDEAWRAKQKGAGA